MGSCGTDKISRLGAGAVFDLTCADESPDTVALSELTGFPHEITEVKRKRVPGVSHVKNCGRSMPVLKILQTSHCRFNCLYCAFRKDCDRPRDTIPPDELAGTTVSMAKAGLIEGLFLSSGIGSSVPDTMSRMIDTVRILREKYLFDGYIHLKILPGSSIDLIEAGGKYADRLSINMEAPTESALKDIAPNKGIQSAIIKQMQWIETLKRTGKIEKRVSQTTQFVVGGSDDPGANDRALVVAANYLYRELNFGRVYYSAFNPVIGTPLENRHPENPLRSHRLYQADFLLKQYGWSADDIVFDENGRLDLEIDPKEKWANENAAIFPIEVTTAEPSLLLKIPGIGPVTMKRIIEARSEGRLRNPDSLSTLENFPRKALRWILVNGKSGEIGSPVVRGWDSPQLKFEF